MAETFQPGDLVEILDHPLTRKPCDCEQNCRLHIGSQGVVTSALFTSLISWVPCHQVQFATISHAIWLPLLRKIRPPPEAEAELTEEELLV
jgi:hypothetical protein